MAAGLDHDLPITLREVRTRPLFVMRLDVRPLQIVGATPGVLRRIGVVPGGVFEGERLSGEVLDGGSDWQAVRSDGSTTLDVRLVLKTSNSHFDFRRFEGLGVKLHRRALDDHGGSGGGLAKASVRSKSSQEGKIRNAVIAASLLKKL